VKLLNKMLAPVEFSHGGKTLKLVPGQPTECDEAFLKDLAQYKAVCGYFDDGKVEVVTDEAPKAKPMTAKPKAEKPKAPPPAPPAQPPAPPPVPADQEQGK
jgi:hypothetical protein